MRRVLVPLDGSPSSQSIIPDARLVAGQDGELILVREASRVGYTEHGSAYRWNASEEVQEYLEAEADRLRGEGVKVQIHTLLCNDVAVAIDEAARLYEADIIACTTHGRGPFGRLIHGGVAWRTLAHSTVPVLLRHAGVKLEDSVPPRLRRIMVPLDGSPYAELALPLAKQMAREWHASLWLVRVIPTLTAPTIPDPYGYGLAYDHHLEVHEAREYLDRLASTMPVAVSTQVFTGRVITELVCAADAYSITDIVMTSHGRTGLSRMVVGSVADSLIHELPLPMVVIPALAAQSLKEAVTKSVGAGTTS